MPETPRLDLVHKAISAGRIRWKRERFERFRDDPDFERFTQKGINSAIQQFVNEGGRFKVKKETDQDWLREHSEDPWLYSAKIRVEGFHPNGMYVKVKLLWEDGDDEDEAVVEIVSIHRSH